MTSSTLEVTRDGAVQLLTIADPPWNIMSVAFMNDLEKEVAAIAADDATRAAVHATFGSADAAEGLQAFMQKRKPVFNK